MAQQQQRHSDFPMVSTLLIYFAEPVFLTCCLGTFSMMETEIPSIVTEVKKMVRPHLSLIESMTDSKNAAGLLKLVGEVESPKKKKN